MKKIILISLMSFLISGCEKDLTYAYLMQHPNVVKKKLEQCQVQSEKQEQQSKQCELVLYAAANLMSLLNEQQEDPEKYGQRILSLQMSLADLKKEIAASSDSVKIKDLQAKYKSQEEELKTLLAVAGITSPE